MTASRENLTTKKVGKKKREKKVVLGYLVCVYERFLWCLSFTLDDSDLLTVSRRLIGLYFEWWLKIQVRQILPLCS